MLGLTGLGMIFICRRNHDRDGRRACASSFLSGSRRVNVPGVIDGQAGDFALGRAVKHESFALGINAINQAAAIGAGNQVPLIVERSTRMWGSSLLKKS